MKKKYNNFYFFFFKVWNIRPSGFRGNEKIKKKNHEIEDFFRACVCIYVADWLEKEKAPSFLMINLHQSIEVIFFQFRWTEAQTLLQEKFYNNQPM